MKLTDDFGKLFFNMVRCKSILHWLKGHGREGGKESGGSKYKQVTLLKKVWLFKWQDKKAK